MSEDPIVEEDSAWAQTFITVTPQEDGFLREIEDTSIVSGNADVPLNLDTWNIVLRRSLIETERDFISPRELVKPIERIATECQTYLQGVPTVELSLSYRDVATQTLYIGKKEEEKYEKASDDIIAVMNEKVLPEWKKSQYVQTAIAFLNDATPDKIAGDLQKDLTETELEKCDTTIPVADMESSDVIRFLIDRTLWMKEPVLPWRIETRDAGTETVIKYNHVTKKLTVDQVVQTILSCDPQYSNSMLTTEYEGTKDFCPRFIDNIVAPNVEKRELSKDFEKSEDQSNVSPERGQGFERARLQELIASRVHRKPREVSSPSRQTKDILLVDNLSYVVRNYSEAGQNQHLLPPCPISRKSSSVDNVSHYERLRSLRPRVNREASVESPRLSSSEVEALDVLKNTLCSKHNCRHPDAITRTARTKRV